MPKITNNSLKKGKFNYSKGKSVFLLLKFDRKKSLVWKGKIKKDHFNKEIPLVLKFKDQDFYFYSSEFKKINCTSPGTKISFRTDLQPHEQRKIINKFTHIIDKKNLYDRYVLLKLKSIFLNKIYFNSLDFLKKMNF